MLSKMKPLTFSPMILICGQTKRKEYTMIIRSEKECGYFIEPLDNSVFVGIFIDDTISFGVRSKTLRISHYPETVTTREQFVMELDNDIHLYLKKESYRAIRDSADLTFKLDSENSDMLLYIYHDLVL